MLSTRMLPAVLAITLGGLLALVLLIPFVFRSYGKRGEVGLGPAILAFSVLIYGFALVAYTLLPVPQIDEAWCAANSAFARPQLDPLRFVSDISSEQPAPGWRGLLGNPAVQQVVFNVALFVPLGAYLRHRRLPILVVVGVGLAVSLFIEFTQWTGNWFLFPCPYRIFDVDDLLANTLGTAIGVPFAPLLRRLDRHSALPADAPRPVTAGRRWLGMAVDFVAVHLLGGVFTVVVTLIAQRDLSTVWYAVLSTWLPAVVLLAVPALGPHGATLGQRAVRLRRVRPDGEPPGPRMVPALLCGGFGYFVIAGLDGIVPHAGGAASVLLLVNLVLAWRPRSHRGLSGLAAGVDVVDSRPPLAQAPSGEPARDRARDS